MRNKKESEGGFTHERIEDFWYGPSLSYSNTVFRVCVEAYKGDFFHDQSNQAWQRLHGSSLVHRPRQDLKLNGFHIKNTVLISTNFTIVEVYAISKNHVYIITLIYFDSKY